MTKPAKPKADRDPVVCIRLKRLREALGLTQREMAERLGGIKQDHYKHFEGRTRPTREVVAAISKQFGLSPTIFLTDESISEEDFNQLLQNLRDGTERNRTNEIHSLHLSRHNDSVGNGGSRTSEGAIMGQNSLDFILGTLAEIKADIANNKKLIADLQDQKHKGFRKGRR